MTPTRCRLQTVQHRHASIISLCAHPRSVVALSCPSGGPSSGIFTSILCLCAVFQKRRLGVTCGMLTLSLTLFIASPKLLSSLFMHCSLASRIGRTQPRDVSLSALLGQAARREGVRGGCAQPRVCMATRCAAADLRVPFSDRATQLQVGYTGYVGSAYGTCCTMTMYLGFCFTYHAVPHFSAVACSGNVERG